MPSIFSRPERAAAVALAAVAAMLVAAGVTGAAPGIPCSATDGSSGKATSNLGAVLAAAKPGDTVHVHGTCIGNFTITVPMTLAGALGAVLDGDGSGTVLTIAVPGGTVNLDTIELTGGSAAEGAGIDVDAGAADPLTLNLDYDRVTGNRASVAGAGLYTGAIAALNIDYSAFTADTVAAGAQAAQGAAIASSAPTDLYESNIIANAASGSNVSGGAVYLTGAATLYAVEVEQTTVTGATIVGAGLDTTAAAGIDESTISGNTATTTSGAITGVGMAATGPSAQITETDVVGNLATSGSGAIHGAGIDLGNGTLLTLSKVGVDGNRATSSTGLIAGVGISAGGPATIANTGIYTNQGISTSGNVEGGGIAARASLDLSDGLVTSNSVSSSAGTADGGGIWTDASTDIDAMTVGTNSAGTAGGGVYLLGAPLTIEGSQLAGDAAPTGAAIDNLGGSVSATGSLIVGSCVACD